MSIETDDSKVNQNKDSLPKVDEKSVGLLHKDGEYSAAEANKAMNLIAGLIQQVQPF